MNAFKFFVEGIKRFKSVGAIARSSKFVARTMCKYVDFSTAKCLVELGAGNGPITKELLAQMGPDTKLLCFEINEELLKSLHEQFDHDPRITIIEDDAAKVGEYIKAAGFDYADHVLSEIPFVIIPDDTIIIEAKKHMRMGGKYVQLQYSTVARKRYNRIFGNTEIDFVMRNIPPAFIHICEKRDNLDTTQPNEQKSKKQK